MQLGPFGETEFRPEPQTSWPASVGLFGAAATLLAGAARRPLVNNISGRAVGF